jgi:hypothetical protein
MQMFNFFDRELLRFGLLLFGTMYQLQQQMEEFRAETQSGEQAAVLDDVKSLLSQRTELTKSQTVSLDNL